MELGDQVVIDAPTVAKRKAELYAHEVLPPDTTALSMGIDIGKRKGHFVVLAGRSNGTIHLPAYGEFDIAGDDLELDLAIQQGIEKFWNEYASAGLMIYGRDGEAMMLGSMMIDSGYGTEGVFAAWRNISGGQRSHAFLPIYGRGSSQTLRAYSHPKKRGTGIVHVGEQWYLSRNRTKSGQRGWAGFINVDYWKDRFHGHITVPMDSPGGLTLYAAPDRDHLQLTQHWAGEQREEKFTPGKGKTISWNRKTKHQHWFDASVYARVGLARLGWSVPK
jgi:hypothetical protein